MTRSARSAPSSENRKTKPAPPAPSEAQAKDPPSAQPDVLRPLLEVKILLRVRLGSTRMNLHDALRVAPGTILELDRGADEPLEVLANGRVIARGEVVSVDGGHGLRITEIGSSSDRIEASGGSERGESPQALW
jgi:flagellar motor switch protein FliN/FliY